MAQSLDKDLAEPSGHAEAATGPHRTRTLKFLSRQAEIIRAAIILINRKGVRGMTLADVAAQLGIVPTGVIYYFPNKEALAAACFVQAIDAYREMIAAAAAGRDRSERLALFVKGHFDHAERAARAEEDGLAVFNDVRALNDPEVNSAYTDMFRAARDLLKERKGGGPDHAVNAIAHLMLSQLFWSRVWLPLYDPSDYARAGRRLTDILQNGLAARPSAWDPRRPPMAIAESTLGSDSREAFLLAATQIINEEGYRGASVEKISARLNVTKGSFYHHHDAKDDLVVACFERSFDVMRAAQRRAAVAADGWTRIRETTVSLVEHEVSGDTPLLRTSALTSAPEPMRDALFAEFGRISMSFASIISDGIADGSVRPVDPHIAAQMITTTINA
ncbi:MAG: TetR/AcrR family transcriptional regulator, partial [Caulobacteraceae bacterium]